MADLTFSNIETRCANALRLPTSNTTEMTKLDALINEVYRDVYAKSDWWWCVKRTVINTVDDVSAVAVSVTSGSTTVTFSSAPVGSRAGTVMIVTTEAGDAGAVYRVPTHTAAALTATLDAAYTGTTSLVATANFYQDAYALPSDFGKGLVNPRRFGQVWPFQWTNIRELLDVKNYDRGVGKPQMAAVWDFTTTGNPESVKMLLVHPYPDNTYRMELYYKQTLNTELSGSTEPFIPDDYRQILVYGTLARGYPIFMNDTERGLFFQNLFNDMLALMTAIQRERSGESPQLVVEDLYRRSTRRRNRHNVNLGGWFDRLPNVP